MAAILHSTILEHLTGSLPGQGAVEGCIVLQGQRRNSLALSHPCLSHPPSGSPVFVLSSQAAKRQHRVPAEHPSSVTQFLRQQQQPLFPDWIRAPLTELALSSTLPPPVALLVPSTSQGPVSVSTEGPSWGATWLRPPPRGPFPPSLGKPVSKH